MYVIQIYRYFKSVESDSNKLMLEWKREECAAGHFFNRNFD